MVYENSYDLDWYDMDRLQMLSFVCSRESVNELLQETLDDSFVYDTDGKFVGIKSEKAIMTLAQMWKNDSIVNEIKGLVATAYKEDSNLFFSSSLAHVSKMRDVLMKYYTTFDMDSIDCYDVLLPIELVERYCG